MTFSETEVTAVAMEFSGELRRRGLGSRTLSNAAKRGDFRPADMVASSCAIRAAFLRFYGRRPNLDSAEDGAVMEAAVKQAFADGFRYYQPHRADA